MTEFETHPDGEGGYVVGDDSAEYEVPNPYPDFTVPSQVQFPMKAVLRTIVAYVLGLLSTLLIRAVPSIEHLVLQAGPALTDAITNAITIGFGAFYTWLMTREWVNHLLTKIGLGARPARAI